MVYYRIDLVWPADPDVDLTEDGLVLALGAKIAREAFAQPCRVVADATPGAIPTFGVAVAHQYVNARRALLKGAVRPAVAQVAHAAHVLHGVPHTGVGLGSIRSELFFGITEAVVGAITRTYSTFTCDAVVVVKAIALASLAIT